MHPNVRKGPLMAVALVLPLAAAIGSIAPTRALAAEQMAWTPITVLYDSDVKGKIDPCG